MHAAASGSAVEARGVATTLRQQHEAAAGASAGAASASGVGARLTPLPFVHRGQNTFVRKLCTTSQGRIIALNRLGLQVMRWAQDEFYRE